jgi:hypothetical protein
MENKKYESWSAKEFAEFITLNEEKFLKWLFDEEVDKELQELIEEGKEKNNE